MKPERALFSQADAAEELDIPVAVVKEAVEDGRLGEVVAGRVVLDAEDLEAIETYAEELEADEE